MAARAWRAASHIGIRRWPAGVADGRWPYSLRRPSSTDTDAATHHPSTAGGLHRLLTDEQRALLTQANQLSSLSKTLARQVGNVPVKEDSLLADVARLQMQRRRRRGGEASASEQEIENAAPSLFTVVFAGEFNAGKSTLINALLGKEMLDVGVLPTTDAITIIMANEDADEGEGDASFEVESATIGLDAGVSAHTQLHLLPTKQYPILTDLCLIDTPGTNAILSLAHTSSTLRILHDADLIVFVTSADRPFSESEKQLLQTSIKSYRKRVVLVINKMDVLERQKGEDHGDATKKRVENYVVEHASDLLGARPVVIPLSARDALSVKLLHNSGGTADENPLWKRSNFGSLEHFLLESLTSMSKVRTKLLNPLGVLEGILIECQSEIQRRQEELDVDVMTLRLLTSQTKAWEKETKSEVIDACQSKIKEVVAARSEVASRVLEETSFFDQLQMLMGRGTFDSAWMRANQRGHRIRNKSEGQDSNHSLGDELMSIGEDCAESLTSRAHNQGTATIEYLGKRPVVVGKGMVGSVTTPKFQQLKQLQPSIIDAIQSATSNLPGDTQSADRIYSSLRTNAALSSLVLGSSVVPATLFMSGVLDATTGMLCGGALAALGCVSLPIGNRYAAASFQKEWTSNAAALEDAIGTLLQDALKRIRSDLADSVAPYSRYVETEGEWLKELAEKLDSGLSNAHSLRSKISKACQ
ncbi:hypothetical protein ACHAXT_009955 [Thalassiosira profunda]